MRTARYRAWHFLHPDLDYPSREPGLGLTPTGDIELVEDLACVRQAILLLLSTRPGERVMRPRYGCWLHRLVFAPKDDTTAGIAIHYVRQALTMWEPRIEILQLDAIPQSSDDGYGSATGGNSAAVPAVPGALQIVLQYRVKALQASDHLVYPIQLTGETP
jgi:phage baseplate assembly protein W